MPFVEFRYITGIGLLSKIPSSDRMFALIRRFFPAAPVKSTERNIIYEVESVADAVQHCSNMMNKLSTSGFFSVLPCSIPLHAAIYEPSSVLPEEIWRLIPVGSAVLPAGEEFPGTCEWLYGWRLLAIAQSSDVSDLFFPLRSLLLTGPNRKECFFCGSHEHSDSECRYFWPVIPEKFTVTRLAAIAPSDWTEHLKTGGEGTSIMDILVFLMQDIRRQFSWRYMLKVCQSSATYHPEMSYAPSRPGSPQISSIKDALKSGDINLVEAALDMSGNTLNKTRLNIVKGFYHLYKGSHEKAMSAWWDAENSATTPLIRSYAALLQGRLHFLQNNIPAALSSSSRAYEQDDSPHTLYWHILFSVLNEQKSGRVGNLRLLANSPEWFTAAVIDPLLLQHQKEVEDIFMTIFKEEEDILRRHIKNLEKLIEQTQEAFGNDFVSDVSIRLRDLLGQFATMGFAEMKRARGSVEHMQKDVQTAINRRVVRILKKIPVLKKRCRAILEKLPRNKRTLPIRKRCLTIISNLNDIAKRKKIADPEKQKGLQFELASIEKEYQELNADYKAYLEMEWQRHLLKRYVAYGIVFVIIVWVILYLLHFLE